MRSSYKDLVTNTAVKECADFKNATDDGAPVFLPPYKNSKASHDLAALAEELLMDADGSTDEDIKENEQVSFPSVPTAANSVSPVESSNLSNQ